MAQNPVHNDAYETMRFKGAWIRDVDEQDVSALLQDPQIMEFILQTKIADERFVHRTFITWIDRDKVTTIRFKESGALVGICGVKAKSKEIFIAVAQQFRRQGVAHEVLPPAIECFKKAMQINELAAKANNANANSIALCKRLRFEITKQGDTDTEYKL